MNPIYRRSPQGGYFHREHIEAFRYSDGSEEERRLFESVRDADDRSTFSPELAAAITDWPSEYHFTRARHCLIRPLGIQPGQRVLELGCGCGAITRYLGEIGAKVVSVEGSAMRASIAALRCADLENVQVVVDDLLRFESEDRFDWVLMVGVLEYAPIFGDPDDPVNHYLRSAARYLVEGGRLVVAIENKLGLKYFNGCSEDHLGVPFVGVQGLYAERGPRTFGRRELAAHLERAGLAHQQFLYPFPDYKLPSVVISQEAIDEPRFDAADLLARAHPRDYSGANVRAFDDALVISGLHENGLLAEMSNSFMLVASAEAVPPIPFFAASYAVRARHADHCIATHFVASSRGYEVRKVPMQPRSADPLVTLPDGLRVSQRLGSEAYVRGRIALWSVLRARAGEGGLEAVVEALSPWFAYLLDHAVQPDPASLAGATLPANFVDCVPANLLSSERGWVFIDQEWVADRPVSLAWVLCRGVLNALAKGVPSRSAHLSVQEVVLALIAAHGRSLPVSDIEHWLAWEGEFQSAITARRTALEPEIRPGTGYLRFADHLPQLALAQRKAEAALADAKRHRDHALARLNSLERSFEHLQQKARLHGERADRRLKESETRARARIEALTTELEQIRASSSWRITRPVRWIAQRFRKPG